MTVTIEVMKRETFDLLKNMESLGLIHMQQPVSAENENSAYKNAWHRLRGIHKNIPGASVADFLANCRTDKERELTGEKRQEHSENV